MSFNGSGDEQSEDGELRQSPAEGRNKAEMLDFSLSEDDADTADSLDIKPPQARISTHPSTTTKMKRPREGHEGSSRSRHKRSDRHRAGERGEERMHSHRDKHHRDGKVSRSGRDRELRESGSHFRDRDVYREKEVYRDVRYTETYKEGKYLEAQYREGARHSETRIKETRELRYVESADKGRREIRHQEIQQGRQEDKREKSAGDRALEDLRERLLNKRNFKGDEDEANYNKSRREYRDRHGYRENAEYDALEGEAGRYVKEMINIGTGDEQEKKERSKKFKAVELLNKKDDNLTEEERAAQELRRLKLLETEKEMARQKEQYRLERERKHLERAHKRKLEELQQEEMRQKRQRDEVVTVSDNSESEMDAEEEEDDDDEEAEDEREAEEPLKSERSDVSERESSSQGSRMSARSSESRGEKSLMGSEREEFTRHRTSPSRSRSRSSTPSDSPTPKSNGNDHADANDNAKTQEEPKSPENPVSKIDDSLPPYFPAIQGCRSVEEFQCLNRIEEGTYGVVYRARDKRTEEIVALKRLKMEKEKEGFPITSLREINTLLKGQHPNIVTVREIVVGSNMDKIFIVMDYVEHDLKSLMETMKHKKQVFVPGEVKCLLKQLLLAVAHLHDNWILHRDLKTSNLLLSHKGILKVGDFGLAREYGSPLKAYTPIVVTLWYRAPELLLCTKEYSTPIDMWSVGCIFAELLHMNALFPGKSEVDQLNRIFKDLGTPNEKIWPGYNKLPAVQKMKFTQYPISQLRTRFSMLSETGLNIMSKFLTYDPVQRVTAEDALQHPYFTEAPLPIDPAMFPTWPAKSELGHRKALAASPKPPSGGREYKQLEDGDEDAIGFRIGGMSSGASMMERRLQMGGGFSLKF